MVSFLQYNHVGNGTSGIFYKFFDDLSNGVTNLIQVKKKLLCFKWKFGTKNRISKLAMLMDRFAGKHNSSSHSNIIWT